MKVYILIDQGDVHSAYASEDIARKHLLKMVAETDTGQDLYNLAESYDYTFSVIDLVEK